MGRAASLWKPELTLWFSPKSVDKGGFKYENSNGEIPVGEPAPQGIAESRGEGFPSDLLLAQGARLFS